MYHELIDIPSLILFRIFDRFTKLRVGHILPKSSACSAVAGAAVRPAEDAPHPDCGS